MPDDNLARMLLVTLTAYKLGVSYNTAEKKYFPESNFSTAPDWVEGCEALKTLYARKCNANMERAIDEATGRRR